MAAPTCPSNEANNESKAIDLDQTRYWIAKCLVMDLKEDYIYGVLLEIGLRKQWIDSEIQLAQKSPYLKAGCKVIQNFTQLSQPDQQQASGKVEVARKNNKSAQFSLKSFLFKTKKKIK